MTKMGEYREKLEQDIADYDVAVGIANAGYGYAGKFEDNDDEYLETIMNLNAIHVYYTVKLLSDRMLKRNKRSAIIVTSSLAAMRPLPMAVGYSAQKAFVTYIARGMALEMGDRIDVLSFNPAEVATKLIFKDESQTGGTVVSVKNAVECCFRDLGHTDMTFGTFNHEFQGWMLFKYSDSTFAYVARETSKEQIGEHL